MGQRISYCKNNSNKGLKELIFENFPSFRKWYLDANQSSIEEFNESFGNEYLISYLEQGGDLLTDFDKLDKKLIDELTSEFVGSFCDLTDPEGKKLTFFGPSMNKWRYDKSDAMVAATRDQAFIRLWNFLIKGRSLKDDGEFNSYTNDYTIGFLTFAEHRYLKTCIETHFGDIATMQKKYWTYSEKRKLKKAIAKSTNESYSLAGHNPKSSGLEYVLQVLNEMADEKTELITGIE